MVLIITQKKLVFLTIFLQQNYKKNLKDKLISKLFKILSCFEMVLLKIIFYKKKKITMVLIITKKNYSFFTNYFFLIVKKNIFLENP
jgi:hypothetical protein